MKIISSTQLKNGKRRVVLEIDPNEKIIAVQPDAHYKLGYPLEDVVPSHVLAEAVQTSWCCLDQKWVE